jgi:hypothetical protein
VYKNISNDPYCETGTVIAHALNLMKDSGIPRRSDIEEISDFREVPLSVYNRSQKFPIEDYATLFTVPRGQNGCGGSGVQAVKKSLSEGKPVIIGMNTPDSFFAFGETTWYPTEDPAVNWGGHAMCVVGYDDDQYNGAGGFEVQNSWGEAWGDDGYIWISYYAFSRFVDEAYEIIEDLTLYEDASQYSGFVVIEVNGSDTGMPVVFDEAGYYKTTDSWASGTRFRFIMGNNHPAYVYAFTSDEATNIPQLIFPNPERNESPILDYSENTVAFPGERAWMEMDTVTGTDYLVVLFSK